MIHNLYVEGPTRSYHVYVYVHTTMKTSVL